MLFLYLNEKIWFLTLFLLITDTHNHLLGVNMADEFENKPDLYEFEDDSYPEYFKDYGVSKEEFGIKLLIFNVNV